MRDIISKLFCLIFKVLLPISYKCLPNSAPRALIFLNYFNQSIIDLQCCAKFCCIAKLPSYAHIHILFHYSLSQESLTLCLLKLQTHIMYVPLSSTLSPQNAFTVYHDLFPLDHHLHTAFSDYSHIPVLANITL